MYMCTTWLPISELHVDAKGATDWVFGKLGWVSLRIQKRLNWDEILSELKIVYSTRLRLLCAKAHHE